MHIFAEDRETLNKIRETLNKIHEATEVEGMEFAYTNLNCMKLLLTASGGTRYVNFMRLTGQPAWGWNNLIYF